MKKKLPPPIPDWAWPANTKVITGKKPRKPNLSPGQLRKKLIEKGEI